MHPKNTDKITNQASNPIPNTAMTKQAIIDLLKQIFEDGKINLDDIPRFIALIKILLGRN